MAGQGAQARAGRIHQDPIHMTQQLRLLVGPGGGIAMAHINAVESQALGIAAHPPQPRFTAIESQHRALIPHQLSQVGALAAGGSAGIQDALTGLWIEQRRNALGCSILHTPMALAEPRQAAEITAAAQQREPLRHPLNRPYFHPSSGQCGLHLSR